MPSALLRLVLVLVAMGCARAVAAAPTDADYRRLNEALVTGHILPRQDKLAEATKALAAEAGRFCAAPTAASLGTMRDAFDRAVDAWQGVQHVRFGPIELFMRNMRLAFWPDPRNTVSRQVDELLAGKDAGALTAQAFARGNVAGQGFPALERLLYGEDAAAKLTGGGAEAAFRCDAIRAIAGNLAGMAADIRREWIEGAEAQAKVMAEAGQSGDRYAGPKEVTLDLFKSLHAAVELVADHKLARPLGASLQAARPQLAEAWRSRRSLAALRLNLEAAEAMYLGEDGGAGFSAFVRDVAGNAALDDLLRRAFAQTRGTAASIGKPLEVAVLDPAERPKLVQLAREASALKTLLAQRLTVALDIPLGFNALDGD
ncbi:imelysin family protein [Desertibaculum subflavum]|uniref:imelysin family protein n=1 Tax=Desertibaculum subflavum TaxID=2268458 RepID=UPI000E673F79